MALKSSYNLFLIAKEKVLTSFGSLLYANTDYVPVCIFSLCDRPF